MSETATRSRLRRWGAEAVTRFYRALYVRLCGSHPDLRPWHFQWLAGSLLYSPLRELLPQLGGRVLDVGCGDKPYEGWMPLAERYVGIDVAPGPKVDAVIEPGRRWPIPDSGFDVVLCTQVLEHVVDVEHTVDELVRALKPGGRLLVTAPFIYNEHGSPHDYRRFSAHGIERILDARSLEILEVRRQGGAGSSIGVLLLNWLEVTFTASAARILVLTLALPAWVACAAAVNALGWAIDRVDRSTLFYGNVLVVAAKRAPGNEALAVPRA